MNIIENVIKCRLRNVEDTMDKIDTMYDDEEQYERDIHFHQLEGRRAELLELMEELKELLK